MIRIFNADDHPILRKGMIELIQQTEGMTWSGSASDGREALEKIRAIRPDIALLDIEMPHASGIEIARQLKYEGLPTRIILLTLFKDPVMVKTALQEGVMGYLLKESPETEIIQCIHAVHTGSKYISPVLTDLMISMTTGDDNDPVAVLSDREKNILRLIARNKTSREIAELLFLSPKTVANHRSNIAKKLSLDGEQNSLLKWAVANKKLLP